MKHADWVTQYKRVFVGQSGEKLQELGPKHSDEQAASQFAQFIKLVDQSETLKDPDGIEITKDEPKLKDRSTSADATYIRNQWTNQKSTSVALWDAYAKVVGNMKARGNSRKGVIWKRRCHSAAAMARSFQSLPRGVDILNRYHSTSFIHCHRQGCCHR